MNASSHWHIRLFYALSMTFPLKYKPVETHTSQILGEIFTCPVIHFLLRAQQQKMYLHCQSWTTRWRPRLDILNAIVDGDRRQILL